MIYLRFSAELHQKIEKTALNNFKTEKTEDLNLRLDSLTEVKNTTNLAHEIDN